MGNEVEKYRGIAGKNFIVTGAGSGIGAAVCSMISELGGGVAAVDIDGAAAERTSSGLSGPSYAVVGDVTTVDGTDSYLDQSFDALGEVHGVHLNAGVLSTPAPIADTYPSDFDWEMAVNAKGVYLGLRGAIRRMRDQGSGGAIAVTVSTAGLAGSQNIAIYTSSKHAALGLVRSAAIDHAIDGIRINAICPGEVNTPMLKRAIEDFSPTEAEVAATRRKVASKIPLERVAEPAELAQAAIWLLSDEASYVTGSTLVVDGGLTAGRFSPRDPELIGAF